MTRSSLQRRDFLRAGVVGVSAAASSLGLAQAMAAPAPPAAGQGSQAPPGAGAPHAAHPDAAALDPHRLLRVTDAGERRGDMLVRTLGHTGEKVSLIGMGGAHLS